MDAGNNGFLNFMPSEELTGFIKPVPSPEAAAMLVLYTSPAKNGIPNPASTTLALAMTHRAWVGS
jgi:hypothetical protein